MIFEVFGLTERGFGKGLLGGWLHLQGLGLYCTRRFYLLRKKGAEEHVGLEIVDLILIEIDHYDTKPDST